jgi:MFS family permease
VLVYDLILIGLIITMGRLGDLFGRRRFYSVGFLVFIAASALCGISQTVGQMIFFRAIQAIGGSMIAANGRAIVSVALPREERGRALGLTSTAFHIGFLTGPSLGGFLIDTIGWRWIFYINLPMALWGAYLAWKIIPETKAEGKVSVDIPGAILLLLTNGLFIYAIDLLPRLGWRHPTFVVTLLLSLVAMAFLLFAETKARTPILILSMFRTHFESLPDYLESVGNQLSFALLFTKSVGLFALPDGLDHHRRLADHHVHGADCRHLVGPARVPPALHHWLRRHCHRAIFHRLTRPAVIVTANHASSSALGSRLGVI